MTTYWAELDTNNIVVDVITGVDDETIEGVSAAEWYSNFTGRTCVQTFMDNPEKTYAGIGDIYDPVTQDFSEPTEA